MSGKIIFVFEGPNGYLYNNPDSYILSKKQNRIEWGDELVIHPVYTKGSDVLRGSETIKAYFYHEGSSGSLSDVKWVSVKRNSKNSWFGLTETNNNVEKLNLDRIVKFNLGTNEPMYFRSPEDLGWYVENIYTLTYYHVFDSNISL